MLSLSNYSFNIYAAPIFFVGCLVLWTGIFVFLQNRKSLINISFGLLCLSLAVWMWGISLVYLSNNPSVAIFWYKLISFLGVINIMPCAYLFSAAWSGTLHTRRAIIFSGFVLSYLFYILGLTTDLIITSRVRMFFWGFYPEYAKYSRLFLVVFAVLFFGAMRDLKSGYNKELAAVKRSQIKMIMIGFIIGATASLDFIPKLSGIALYPFGYIAMFIFCCIVGYAIIKHRIFDIESVFHKTLMWSALSSVIVLPIIIFSYILKPWFISAKWWQIAMLSAGSFFVLMSYMRVVQPRIDHVFQRRKFDLEKASNKFVEGLVHLKGLGELLDKLEETIKSALYSQKIAINIYDAYSRDDIFLKWLFKNNEIAGKDFIDIDPRYESIKAAAAEYFEKNNAVLAVPLVLNERPLGVINLGKKVNLRRYNTFDLQFLKRLKSEATIAISNSLLYDSVEEKVRERTRELMETQKQLVQAEKLATVGTLAGGVAHEINNPLAAILTNAQIMLTDERDEDDKDSLELIEEAAKRCRSIVQKLMVYSRKPLIGREVTKVDLNNVLKSVNSFLGYQLAQENIRVEIKLENPPFIVEGCQNELEQVFTNLFLNSKDAIKKIKKSGDISVFISKTKDEIIIKIKDEGCGIKKENISKIFDPFFTTKDVGKGTGLGLSICQSIIEEHNGAISVNSHEGLGATFTIILPAVKL